MQIDIQRIQATLLDLSRIGFNEDDKGIYRTSFSESDMAARGMHRIIRRRQRYIG